MNSFKHNNILKSEGVVFKGVKPLKTIATDKLNIAHNNKIDESIKIELENTREELELQIEQAKKEYEEIVKEAELKSESIIQQASESAKDIKKEAYEEGHTQGLKNGYEDGYKEAYEENIEKAKLESEEITNQANHILIDAKNKVANYLKDNKKQIIDLSITIAEKVLKEKFNEIDSMNKIIESAISEYEIKENFVIRTNSIYIESLNEEVTSLKEEQSIKGEVFILPDDSIDQGNAIIETNKGRLIIGIDCVLEKVKEELL
ncbi:MAG: FliH/SctL family protein [Paraclostridium sp.]|uniref:FliH/SctL family protein n=1 Tax=Paraclostridium sp. TaxID=2023273 RepID=UPI003F2F4746